MTDAREISRARWLPLLIREAETLQQAMPALLAELRHASPLEASWMQRSLTEALHGAATIVPEVPATAAAAELAGLCHPATLPAAA